jgi:Asp-tRNA(Asn)/Glu-tRNA(Gln) amidotransferase A subunit family amidase
MDTFDLPFAPSLDTVGPMARSVQDAATLYAVMAGRDEQDGWSFKTNVPEPVLDPVTLQIVGPQHGEARLLALGQAYQATTKWHQLRPIPDRRRLRPNAIVEYDPSARLR